MRLFTIGFTKKSAEDFFSRLKKAGVKKLIDVRLNNVSQLSGFAKRDDLRFFAEMICNIPYVHYYQKLAPTQEMLNEYKKNKGEWSSYERKFQRLITQRKIETMNKAEIDGGCLLCSEDKPHKCHRRLVAEYLNKKWGNVEIVHL